uniref:FANCI_HD2 domain-containing protein n=1 Tax=Angiostrongylus cantonensis TaxID=6313 RepID=A0A158P7U0_ANGCA
MQDRPSQRSSSSQLSTGTPFGTQNSGNKVTIDTFVHKFIEHGKELESKRKSGQEETFVADIKGRVFNFLRSTVRKDKAAKLTDFYSSWCQLTSLLDEEDRVSCRVAGLRLALEVLSINPVICLYVSTLYDEAVKQIQLCDSGQILPLLETHSGTLAVPSLSNRCLSMDDMIEKYLDERALEDLLDVEQRSTTTSKCVYLLRVLDNKRLSRVLREMILAWPKKRGVAPAVGLMSCVHEMVKVARDYPNSEPGMVMCSEFGFLLAFALCSIDRYKTSTVLELTKAFQKLWTFRENIHEFGWIENSSLGEVVDIAEDQVTCLVKRLGEDVEAHDLLSDPTVLLMQSLLKLPSTVEITIVDGRVADGYPIWLFASKVLVKLVISRRKELGTHLALIIELVATSSTSVSFICVDMLVDIVRQCTLDVLNNWRELETLFKNICYIRRDISVSLVRTAVYLGFAEEGKRKSPMAGQCLDFLVSHAATTPEWKAETMCMTDGGVVTLVEPLPHLVQVRDF